MVLEYLCDLRKPFPLVGARLLRSKQFYWNTFHRKKHNPNYSIIFKSDTRVQLESDCTPLARPTSCQTWCIFFVQSVLWCWCWIWFFSNLDSSELLLFNFALARLQPNIGCTSRREGSRRLWSLNSVDIPLFLGFSGHRSTTPSTRPWALFTKSEGLSSIFELLDFSTIRQSLGFLDYGWLVNVHLYLFLPPDWNPYARFPCFWIF